MSEAGAYYSFLLRMWQVPGNREYTWRILLENIHTGEKSGFPDLDGLLAFLSALTIDLTDKPGEGSQTEVQG